MKFTKTAILFLGASLLGIWLLTKHWLPRGYMVAGHDSGLAINSGQFLQSRFFAWDPQGFGKDNSMHFGSLILHGFDYLFSLIAGVSYAGNQVTIFFWLGLIFLTAFIFTHKLRDLLGKYSPFIFPPIVTFNFYIIQSIFVVERAKYAILVALLFILLNIIYVLEKKYSIIKAIVFSSLVLFLFNSGSWLGTPLYGNLFALILSVLLFELILLFKSKKFNRIKRLVSYLFGVGLVFLLLNSYSLWPYLSTFFNRDASLLVDVNTISQNKAWLEALSQATSFLNIFRLQGVPDWYSGANSVNLSHPYASDYLNNSWLVILSFVFPILALLSFILVKDKTKKRMVSFFGLGYLVSMFFVAGSHRPLGFLYEFMYDVIPGFSIFRSPYFKFGGVYFVTFGLLVAFTISSLISRIVHRFNTKIKLIGGVFLSLVFVAFWLSYHFVVFYPEKIFTWQRGYATRIKTPDYLKDFEVLMKKEEFVDKRIVLVPPLNSDWRNDAYAWGYWSLTDLPSTLSNRSFLVNDSSLTDEQGRWLEKLYEYMKMGKEEELIDISSRLGVSYFLLRKDALSDFTWSSSENPQEYENVLEEFVKVNKVENVGNWILYKIDSEPDLKIRTATSLVSIPKDSSYLARDFLKNMDTIVNSENNNSVLSAFTESKLSVFPCQSCLLERVISDTLPAAGILPSSKIYYLKELREKKELSLAETDEQKINTYLGFIFRRAAETVRMLEIDAQERSLASNLQTMNEYLSNLVELIQRTSNPNRDFAGANRLLDILIPVEVGFQSNVNNEYFNLKGEAARQEMHEVLWKIYLIKKYYDPILSDIKKWNSEKIIPIKFDGAGEHDLYINKSLFPISKEENPIFPLSVSYATEEGVSAQVTLQNLDTDWVNLKVTSKDSSLGHISMVFDNLPDLFQLVGTSLKPLPVGERSCVVGKIYPFRLQSNYRLNLTVSRADQNLKVIFKGTESNFPITNQFLRGDDEKDIVPSVTGLSFSYLLDPSPNSKDPTIFICSSNKDKPRLESVEVKEVFSPSLVYAQKQNPLNVFAPEITFERISPSKYLFHITNAKSPYILVFNETFNPQWEIFKVAGNKNKSLFKREHTDDLLVSEDSHFMINDYANAWLMESEDSGEYVLMYKPEKLFHQGLIITTIVVLIVTGLGVYFIKQEIAQKK